MAFLLAGVALGATAIALSDRDRTYYRTSRYSMDYLGNKAGVDVYKDRVTGYYYSDDGWDVRRVGKQGWRPHPVDVERLKGKLAKYSPTQLNFCGYILATYVDNEQALWNTIFKKFEMPKQPPKPHFARGLRKGRWARYDEELEAWEKAAAKAKQEFRDECEAWNVKRREYNASHVNAATGSNLLLMALAPKARPAADVFRLKVPDGKKPGDTVQIQAGGRTITVMIPAGSAPGTEIQFEIPRQGAPSLPTSAPARNLQIDPGLPVAAPLATAVPPPIMPPPPPAIGRKSAASASGPAESQNPTAPPTESTSVAGRGLSEIAPVTSFRL